MLRVSQRYRNRPTGEFLKALDLTEGHSTGVPKILKAMAANGSPTPLFDTDNDRAAYVIRLPVHPQARVDERAPAETTGQVTREVTTEVRRLVAAVRGSEEFTRQELQDALALKNAKHFRRAYLLPALASGMVEMTRARHAAQQQAALPLAAHASHWLAKEREGN